MRTKFIIIFIYLTTSVLFLYLIRTAYNNELHTYLNSKTTDLETAYEKIVQAYSVPAGLIFNLEINKPEILSLIAKANKADSLEKADIRKKLYSTLRTSYEEMERHKYRQVHFHLSDNTSFLRFHSPDRYGDDLSEVRSTVSHTNKYKEYSQGFEEGTVLSAFRYVFPLEYEGTHIGSVELSVSYLGIISIIEENKDIACSFMISREIVDRKSSAAGNESYLTCNANNNFYVEREGHDKIIRKIINGIEYPKIFRKFYENPKAQELFDSFSSGTLITEVDDKNFTVTIIRILNFDNEPVAYLTGIMKDEYRDKLIMSYFIYGSIRFAVIMLFLTLLTVTILKNRELNAAREEIKVLDGLLPICSFCKKIRDEEGHWDEVESYIHNRSEATMSHSVCPECAEKHYGEFLKKTRNGS